MRAYRILGIITCILLLTALISLLSDNAQAVFTCSTYDCLNGDASSDDFVQGYFYATGIGTGGVLLLPMGLTSQWGPDPHTLPGNRAELATVIYKDIIYAIGGWDETGIRRAEIFSATSTIAGPLTASGWVTPTTLPVPLGSPAAVISTTANGAILYVIGGDASGGFTSTISYRSLTPNGAFTGSWQNVYNALPTPLVYASAVVRNGNLYVIGGHDPNFVDNANIFRFPINPGGSPSSVVTETNTLPTGRSLAPSVVWTDISGVDHLYVVGGLTGSTALNRVLRATFNPADNSVGPFVDDDNDHLLNSLTAHGTVQSNGRMFVTGGQEGAPQEPITKVHSALIDPASNLHNWGTSAWVASTPLPNPRSFHGTVINSGGEIYVIGGYGSGTSNGTNTVYHGSTLGFGKLYAPSGNFTSRYIDLSSPHLVNEIDIGSTITGTTSMTIQYRYGLSKDNLSVWTNLPWSLPTSTATSMISSTFPVSLTAGIIQYRTYLTSSVSYDASPILNAFLVKYSSPTSGLPDLTVAGMDAPPASVNGPTLINVLVQNIGKSPSRPTPKVKSASGENPSTNSTQQPSRPEPRGPASGQGWFFVDVYIDNKPANAGELGVCYGTPASLNPGATIQIPISCTVTTGPHIYYAQVDTCPPGNLGCSPAWGYIAESDELNNISPAYPSGTRYQRLLFLPLIKK